MRIFFRILAGLNIICAMNIAITVTAIYSAYSKYNNVTHLNWDFLIPFLIVNTLILLLGASGSITLATNKHVWKKLDDLQKIQDKLDNEYKEINQIKNKVLEIIIKRNEKDISSNN